MKQKLMGLSIAGFIIAPLVAFASSDDSQYPAANFQPKVIFSDESVKTISFDPDYPAANFQPKVIFVDTSVATNGSKGKKSAFDPNFPAANFVPKVIYP